MRSFLSACAGCSGLSATMRRKYWTLAEWMSFKKRKGRHHPGFPSCWRTQWTFERETGVLRSIWPGWREGAHRARPQPCRQLIQKHPQDKLAVDFLRPRIQPRALLPSPSSLGMKKPQLTVDKRGGKRPASYGHREKRVAPLAPLLLNPHSQEEMETFSEAMTDKYFNTNNLKEAPPLRGRANRPLRPPCGCRVSAEGDGPVAPRNAQVRSPASRADLFKSARDLRSRRLHLCRHASHLARPRWAYQPHAAFREASPWLSLLGKIWNIVPLDEGSVVLGDILPLVRQIMR